MAIVEIALPYPEKLKLPITKVISFNVNTSKTRNQYIRVIPKGISSTQDKISLKYIGLTDAEFATIEAIFKVQETDRVLIYTPPSELNPRRFRFPTSWKTSRTRLAESSRLFHNTFEFELISYGQVLGSSMARVQRFSYQFQLSNVSDTPGTEIVYCPDTLYVGLDANPGLYEVDNIITKIDSLTGTPLLTFSTGGLGNLKSDGTNVWVSNKHHSLYRYIPPLTFIAFAGFWGEFSHFGSSIYALSGGYLRKFNKLTGGDEVYISSEGSGHIMADASGVYYINETSLKITSLDLSETEVISLPGVGSHIALTPTNIWVTGKPDKVYRINKMTKEVTAYTVSGLETSDARDAYIQYVPQVPALILSRAMIEQLSVINEKATNSSTLLLYSQTTNGQPREVVGVSATSAYVVTSNAVQKLSFP